MRLFRPHVARRVHRARPPAAADGARSRSSGGGCSRASTASSSTASTAATTLAPARRRRARHPASRLPERSGAHATTGARCSLRRHPSVQGARRRDRGGARVPAARACSSPATRSSRSSRTGAAARASTSSGGSATSPHAEVDRALGDATVALFPYRPELDQSGALLRALGAGVPGGRLRRRRRRRAGARASAPGASSRRATSRRSPPRCASCSTTRGARGGARRRAARARRADVGRGGPGTPRALRGARVIFRAAASPT